MARDVEVRGQGVLMDALLAEEHGPALARELLPAALRANPGVAALGPVLPPGTVVTIPDRPVRESRPRRRQVVSLFGGNA